MILFLIPPCLFALALCLWIMDRIWNMDGFGLGFGLVRYPETK